MPEFIMKFNERPERVIWMYTSENPGSQEWRSCFSRLVLREQSDYATARTDVV